MNKTQTIEFEILTEIKRICMKEDIPFQLAYGSLLGCIREKGFIPWDEDIDIMVWGKDYERFCEAIKLNISDSIQLFINSSANEYELLFARVGVKGNTHFNTHVDVFPFSGAPEKKVNQYWFQKAVYLIFRAYFAKKIKLRDYSSNRVEKRILLIIVKAVLFIFSPKLLRTLHKWLAERYDPYKTGFACNVCGSYGFREILPFEYIESSANGVFEGDEFPVPQNSHLYLSHFYGDYMTPRKTV